MTEIILYGIMNIQPKKWCSFVISLSTSNKPYSAHSLRPPKVSTPHFSPSWTRISTSLLFFSSPSKGSKSIYSRKSASWQLCAYVSRFWYGRFWSFSNRPILLGPDTLVLLLSYLLQSISQTTALQNNSLHAQRIQEHILQSTYSLFRTILSEQTPAQKTSIYNQTVPECTKKVGWKTPKICDKPRYARDSWTIVSLPKEQKRKTDSQVLSHSESGKMCRFTWKRTYSHLSWAQKTKTK